MAFCKLEKSMRRSEENVLINALKYAIYTGNWEAFIDVTVIISENVTQISDESVGKMIAVIEHYVKKEVPLFDFGETYREHLGTFADFLRREYANRRLESCPDDAEETKEEEVMKCRQVMS